MQSIKIHSVADIITQAGIIFNLHVIVESSIDDKQRHSIKTEYILIGEGFQPAFVTTSVKKLNKYLDKFINKPKDDDEEDEPIIGEDVSHIIDLSMVSRSDGYPFRDNY